MRRLIYLIGILLVVGVAGTIFYQPTLRIAHNSPQPPLNLSGGEKYTLLFTGDIMLDRGVAGVIRREQDPLYPFLKIAEVTSAADITIGNLEGPISSRGQNQGSVYSFRFEPVGSIHGLQYAGFDVLSLANNHIWDWGRDALLDTVTHLESAGIKTAGAGADESIANAPAVSVLPDGTQIAFLSYTNLYPAGLAAGPDWPGVSHYGLISMTTAISKAKADGADVVVMLIHWGTEYEQQSSPDQQYVARQLIDAGADLIIGHHPHVAQEVEEYISPLVAGAHSGRSAERIGYIAYSLGNFVFDQNFSDATMRGLMAEATIQAGKIVDFKTIPIRINNTFQPFILDSEGNSGGL
ncbi:MAG: hypothetical protein COU11_04375 [Candidatus Harrisonbacteria bacterium CG10_big_fil_rev_8_21_14_0_10_49_15]|uniref:Capsule synthesis protein CapA domain-containing protein n=1 Tax=Candidatus Harrisonbacteria bacterium CG10_big_fil_rev_8_21_14_0_10_49_15 TaxID=1974587 RepID=A0A2H0UJY9_9BACT|nr:MAG: hypothetical protein COU11_04375 [Candidatus Harrisonbacteria bacterium CG10_big_fil_rev_8_21_14_0_10_49_15]